MLLTSDNCALLVAFSAVGSLGDRAASVLTKLCATRVAGPDRVRYQALNHTLARHRHRPDLRHPAPHGP